MPCSGIKDVLHAHLKDVGQVIIAQAFAPNGLKYPAARSEEVKEKEEGFKRGERMAIMK